LKELIATASQTGSTSNPHSQTSLEPAEIDYVVRIYPVDNPLGLKALEHQRIFNVWKVLIDHDRHVVQTLHLVSSTVMDQRIVH